MPDRPSEYLALIHISDLANLGPDPRPSRLPRNELESQLESWFTSRSVPDDARPALLAAALLWHDYLEDAHVLAQDIATTTGSFLHAIMHRREPDFNNACYWFHRVGRHECFYAIARAATPFLVKHGEAQLASRLLPNGLWNPFAFVDACAEVYRQGPSALNPATLRQLQRIELESLATDLLTSPVATGRET
ncbi:MAG: hypothetical protein KJ072_14160 [Verrucomicrobia bacterium]|nr:hypothetical protein [Verrucomicrobiota bacterium]